MFPSKQSEKKRGKPGPGIPWKRNTGRMSRAKFFLFFFFFRLLIIFEVVISPVGKTKKGNCLTASTARPLLDTCALLDRDGGLIIDSSRSHAFLWKQLVCSYISYRTIILAHLDLSSHR